MPLPVPVEMPSPLPVNQKSFDLNYNQSMSPAGSQFIQTIEHAPPAWIARYSTPPLSPERDQVFQAFIDSLQGSMVPFLAFDPRRPKPYYYRNMGGEPWVRPTFSAVRVIDANWTNSTLSCDRFADGAVITVGDYIAFKRVNRWHLHRVMIAATAGVGTGTVTLTVTPRPVTDTTDVDARMTKACCAMKIFGTPEKTDKVEDIGPKYSFTAIQFADRST